MTSFDRVLIDAERWVEDVDRERDHLAKLLTWDVTTPVERAFIEARLVFLEGERQQALEYLAQLQALRLNPMAMFSRRPTHRMLKVPLRREREQRKRA